MRVKFVMFPVAELAFSTVLLQAFAIPVRCAVSTGLLQCYTFVFVLTLTFIQFFNEFVSVVKVNREKAFIILYKIDNIFTIDTCKHVYITFRGKAV